VACYDRLGGAITDGLFAAFCSDVDYVRLRCERYKPRPAGSPPDPTRILARRAPHRRPAAVVSR
jgi:hypothetical protein